MRRNLLIAFVVSLLILSTIGSLGEAPDSSTYSPKRGGIKALYLLLEGHNLPVSRWLKPFTDLQGEGKVLFLVSPTSMGGEEKLLEWIAGGNTLVLLDAEKVTEKLRTALGIGTPRKISSFLDLLSSRYRTLNFKCPHHLRVCHGVGEVIRPGRLLGKIPEHATPLTRPPFMFMMTHGRGSVWYLPDASIASNYHIDELDHLRLLYQLALEGKEVLFDEFHHGYTAPVGELEREKLQTVLLFLAYVTFCLLLAVASRAVRFGPPRPEPLVKPSRHSELLDVLSSLYEEHQAYEALKSYVEGWKLRVQKKFGVHASYPHAERVKRLMHSRVIDAGKKDQLEHALSVLLQETQGDMSRSIEILEAVVEAR